MEQATLPPMCSWVSIDEFVDLQTAAFDDYPLGSGTDMETRRYCVECLAASQRKRLGSLLTIASRLDMTLRVRGRLDVKADLMPTQFLLRSADGSVEQAIDGYAKAIDWLKAYWLSLPAQVEARALAESLSHFKSSHVDRKAIRI